MSPHGAWATLLQVPEVVPGSGVAHCRSRFTDQKVNRARCFCCAYASMVRISGCRTSSPASVLPFIVAMPLIR